MTSGRAILYAAVTGAVGLGVRSIVSGPVPMPVAGGAAVAFATIVLAGVFEPRLGMFLDVINRGEPADAPRVALTFDDGPSVDTTARVLDHLDEAEAKGTFFVIGRKLRGEGAALARRARERGHAIGCHGYDHDRFFALRGERTVREDLLRALATIEDATGAPTRLFRPPIGHTNPTIARVVEELGLLTIGFSVRAYDGVARARKDRVARRVIDGLDDGAIVLLHDASEREDFAPVAPDVLPEVLAAMRERGLAAVTVEEMIS